MDEKKVINADLFRLKKEKKQVHAPAVSSIKRALLKKILDKETIPPTIEKSIEELEQITKAIPQAPQPKPPPQYSSIKNGSKPTFRQMKRTFKTKNDVPEEKHIVKHYSDFGKKTRTRKINIFIKNITDRKNIEDEIKILDTQEFALIKEYLIKRDLIKIGSIAPESLMREIYKNSILAGDIHNKNPNNLIHNYINSHEAKAVM